MCPRLVPRIRGTHDLIQIIKSGVPEFLGNAYETQSPPNDLGQRPTSYSFYDGDGNVCFSQTQAEFATGTFTQ